MRTPGAWCTRGRRVAGFDGDRRWVAPVDGGPEAMLACRAGNQGKKEEGVPPRPVASGRLGLRCDEEDNLSRPRPRSGSPTRFGPSGAAWALAGTAGGGRERKLGVPGRGWNGTPRLAGSLAIAPRTDPHGSPVKGSVLSCDARGCLSQQRRDKAKTRSGCRASTAAAGTASDQGRRLPFCCRLASRKKKSCSASFSCVCSADDRATSNNLQLVPRCLPPPGLG